MRITRIHLTNFRNYSDHSIMPTNGMNVLVGSNGQGKSAVLEAAYVIATSKSQRTSRDSDMIKIGEDWARVSCEIERDLREDSILELILSRKEKKIVKINKARYDRIGDLVGQLNAVVFSSSDLETIRGEPSNRRRFLNLEIGQISPQYVYSLGSYKRVLEQRNSILKNAKNTGAAAASLDVWDEQIAIYGAVLMEKRLQFVKSLSEIAEPIYNKLTGGTERLELSYQPSVNLEGNSSLEDIRRTLAEETANRRERDLFRGTTTRGPHRDDIKFIVNDMEVRYFGSQGQQRSAALAIKLAEIELMEEAVGEAPVALLDDVTADLDEERRRQVFDFTLGRCQTIVTATSTNDLPADLVEKSAIFEVASGTVERL